VVCRCPGGSLVLHSLARCRAACVHRGAFLTRSGRRDAATASAAPGNISLERRLRRPLLVSGYAITDKRAGKSCHSVVGRRCGRRFRRRARNSSPRPRFLARAVAQRSPARANWMLSAVARGFGSTPDTISRTNGTTAAM